MESRRDHHHRPRLRGECREDPAWAPIKAVQRGACTCRPSCRSAGSISRPRVNRLIGLWWLAKILYPELFPEDLRALTRDFYARFYHVTPNAEQIERVLAGRD